MLIDTHAHLTDVEFENRLDDVINSAKSEGVEKIFTVSYTKDTIDKCVGIAEKYPNVYAIIGIHPEEIDDFDDEVIEKLIKYSSHEKVVGIGEIGLEYHFLPDDEGEKKRIKQRQEDVFIEQLRIANKVNLPVSIHQRDSVGDLIKILKENKHLLNNGGVIHCFSESVESFKEFEKLGLKVAFGGVLTFKNSGNAPKVAINFDLSNFMLETDCPYLTPEPFRGRCKNEPKYVKYVCLKLAELKNCSIQEVEEITTKNALDVFKKARN